MLGGEKQKVTLMFDPDILSEIFDSFLSYSRHGYFRRILCNMLGGMSDRGEITADTDIKIKNKKADVTVKIRRRRLFSRKKGKRKSESVEIPIIRFVHVHAVFRVGGRPIFSRRRAHEFFEILIEIDVAFISRLNPHFVDGKFRGGK